VVGYPAVSADNWAGGVQTDTLKVIRVEEPHPYAPVLTHTAENAYQLVLADAGAVLPKRDEIDTRLIDEVKTGTATFCGIWGPGSGIIDSQTQVGSWPALRSDPAPRDSDHDGMPDEWEKAKGLNISDPEDRNLDQDGNGYTNLEKYLNELCVREDFILAPAGLTATVLSTSQIKLKWQEQAVNETGFVIERSEDDGNIFHGIATLAANDTGFLDLNLAPEVTYFYRVRAFNDSGISIYTNIATAITKVITPEQP
jgi:hypothetical protein